jgi:hypothetical protein
MSANISIADLEHAVALRTKIDAFQSELAQILGVARTTNKVGRPRKGMSLAGHRRIALAQKKRWAEVKKPRRTMSAAARARISAAAKKRWKKAKAAGKNSL